MSKLFPSFFTREHKFYAIEGKIFNRAVIKTVYGF